MSSRLETLPQLVHRLAGPIAFASRDAFAHLSTIKSLGPFVCRQIIQALTDHIDQPEIETDLLALRDLFVDFDRVSDSAEQRRRLRSAQIILERLKASRAGGESEHEPHRSSTPIESVAHRHPPVSGLPVQFIRGIGPKRAALLERLGIMTVEDALWFLPWRYEDRSTIMPIGQVTLGAHVTICGIVQDCRAIRTFSRGMTLVQVGITDSSGTLSAIFFNQPYLERTFSPGTRIMMNGRITAGRGGWTDLQMESPHYEVLGKEHDTVVHVGRIVPLYHETKGVTSRQLRSLIKELLDDYGAGIEDLLPAPMRRRYNLPSIQKALAEVHFPSKGTDDQSLERGITPAHRRLAFEECLLLQLALAMRHRSVKNDLKGIAFRVVTPLLDQLRKRLSYKLTAAQQCVLSEIKQDMAIPRPMNRLVQGDVGCGKTIVALHAMVIASGSGYQAALMAPTEILAEQHYLTMRALIQDLGLTVVLLKSGGSAKAKKLARDQIRRGEAQIVIGTQALIQQGIEFKKLGLVVVDEQHKFGVLQRKSLVEKGMEPDVLVLTATPIPRTLAMTVYGDLDVSVIDTLPPGRKPIKTWLFSIGQRRRAYQVLREELTAGHQAYIVYPLVEESEKVDLQAAIQASERLQTTEFSQYRVGLLHGRMKNDEKERTMAAFKAGEIQILVATTVIEVGVDVQNATVMLIEHAERFGLAQLHQLRGRVGRGTILSYCLLVTAGHPREGSKQSTAQQRLEALVSSTDGFHLAEEDLRIRGPGEFFGVRQWGLPEFRAADLIRDRVLLEQARSEAFAWVQRDPYLAAPSSQAVREAMLRRWKERLELGAIC